MRTLPLAALLLPVLLQGACTSQAQAALAETPVNETPAPKVQEKGIHIVTQRGGKTITASGATEAELHQALVKELGSEEEARQLEAELAQQFKEAERQRQWAEKYRTEAMEQARISRAEAQKIAKEAMRQARIELKRVQLALDKQGDVLSDLEPPLPPEALAPQDIDDLEVILDLIGEADLSPADKAAISQALNGRGG